MTFVYLISIIIAICYSTTVRASTTGGSQAICGVFQTFPGQQALGATAQTGITTNADCEQYCVTGDPTCTAYEYDTNVGHERCWIHRAIVDTVNGLYDDPLITLYVLRSRGSCPSATVSGASSSVSLPASTTTTPVPTGGGCGSYTKYSGQHALGAQAVAGINTEQQCLDNCITTTTCTAYEYTNATNAQFRCWFHSAPINVPGDLYNDDPTISISILDRFPCTSTTSGPSVSTSSTSATTTSNGGVGPGQCFLTLVNTNVIGAQKFPEATSDQQCRTICLGMSSCTAYLTDNFAGFECWLYLQTLGELYFTADVTINVRTSCETTTSVQPGTGGVGQCVVFAPPLPDTQSLGALPGGNVDNDTCLNLCKNDATCVAYEIDTARTDSRCWLHHDINNLAVVYTTDFVDQFRVISRECVTTVSTSPGTTTTTQSVPSNCAIYGQFNQTQSIGATPQDGVTSADECRRRCTTNANCVAYELDTNPANPYCWIHTNATTLLIQYDAPTVTQYPVTSRDCTTGSTGSATTSSGTTVSTTAGTGSTASTVTSTGVPGACQFTWTRIDNVNIPGGTPNRAVDLNSCQTACTNNLYCIGIDVNTNNGLFFCYIIIQDNPLTPFQGNTHYTLTRSAGCPTGPPTAPPTTTPGTTVSVIPGTGCTNFRVSVGANADGGFLLGRMSRQACLIACVGDPTCLAVDFSEADQLCFSHTSLAGFQPATCCVRYECASSPCADTYVRYPDRSPSLSLGEVQNGVTTAQACQAACATKNCSRFSFVNAARDRQQACYLYYASTAAAGRDAVTVQVGVDLWIRKWCIQSPALPPTTTVTSPASLPPGYCPIDLVFIVDSSGSIRDNQPPGVDNWSLIKAFVKDIIQTYLSIGLMTDHVGLVTFSDNAILNFDLNRYTDQASMLTAIDNLPFIGYETNTPAALVLAEQIFTSSARNRSARYAVLITDGVVSPQWEALYPPEVANLNQLVKSRYAIGVTTQISQSELYLFTGNQDAVTTVLSFSDLNTGSAALGSFINSVDCSGNSLLTSPLTTTGSTRSASVSVSGTATTSSGGGQPPASSTATTTTTTAAPTTTPEPPGGEGCFGAVTRTSTNGRADPLTFPSLLANRNNVYITSLDSYVSTAVSGFYFIEICAGMISGTMTEVATRGAYPPLAFVWSSTAHNGVISNCRSGVLSMTRGVRVYLQQISTNGGVSSDNNVQTSWSMFSITDVIRSPLSVLSAVYRQPVTSPAVIPFINPTANPPGQYNPSTYEYLCNTNGAYFFSFSAGVAGGQTAALRLVGLNSVFEVTSGSSIQNSLITLDRSVVTQCSTGSRVKIQVTSGQISPGGSGQNLITFQAFPYQMFNGTSAAWGLFRTTSLSNSGTATDPLPFDRPDVTQGITLNNNVVTLTLGGYYYIYASVGAPAGQRVFITVRRNSQTLFSVLREATNDNGVQTLGQGMVILFQTGDTLKIVNEANSGLSSTPDGLHCSFVGIRLYAS